MIYPCSDVEGMRGEFKVALEVITDQVLEITNAVTSHDYNRKRLESDINHLQATIQAIFIELDKKKPLYLACRCHPEETQLDSPFASVTER